MNFKIVIFLLFLVGQGITLGQSAEHTTAKRKPSENTWRMRDELQHIKINLGKAKQTGELNDISKIQEKLTHIEKALGYGASTGVAAQIQQEESQNSLRQVDDSLNSLKLDELNRIEKTFNYDAWLDYCAKSPDCKKHETPNQK
jgi:hypothetical protein